MLLDIRVRGDAESRVHDSSTFPRLTSDRGTTQPSEVRLGDVRQMPRVQAWLNGASAKFKALQGRSSMESALNIVWGC